MEQTTDNYELCYENLCKELINHDPEIIAHNCGIIFDAENQLFIMRFLNRDIKIEYPSGIISIVTNGTPPIVDYLDLCVMERILAISFLLRCVHGPLAGKWVPLRELRGVGYAYDKFAREGIDTFINYFTGKEDLLLQVGNILGETYNSLGDIAIKIEVLPKVPLLLALWYGDEEFPTTATILFDYSATDKLHIEDLAALGSLVVREIKIIAKQLLIK